MLKKPALSACLAALALAIPAQARVQLGVLRCTIEGGQGYLITSNKALDCTYRSSRDGSRERYTGVT